MSPMPEQYTSLSQLVPLHQKQDNDDLSLSTIRALLLAARA